MATEERIEPWFIASYRVRFGDEIYALYYSHLNCTYQERRVAPGRRGMVIVKRYKPFHFMTAKTFAGLSISRIVSDDPGDGDTRWFKLEIHPIPDAMLESGLLNFWALPYRPYHPFTDEEATDARSPEQAMRHLKEDLFSNLSIDPLRAAIGDDWPIDESIGQFRLRKVQGRHDIRVNWKTTIGKT